MKLREEGQDNDKPLKSQEKEQPKPRTKKMRSSTKRERVDKHSNKNEQKKRAWGAGRQASRQARVATAKEKTRNELGQERTEGQKEQIARTSGNGERARHIRSRAHCV